MSTFVGHAMYRGQTLAKWDFVFAETDPLAVKFPTISDVCIDPIGPTGRMNSLRIKQNYRDKSMEN